MKELFSRALAALAALTVRQEQQWIWNGTCSASGLHLIVARGSTEAPGLGRIGVVAQNVTLMLPGTSIAAVTYPATFSDYFKSAATGSDQFEKLILEHVAACPDTKIALLGYSQGAHALMDAICGSSLEKYFVEPNLTKAYEENVVASVLFGDPSHTLGAPWNYGTSNKSTVLFPRNNITACEKFAPTIRSWCDTGDVYCDAGNNTRTHGSYFANYTLDATEFIVQRFNESSSDGDDNNSDAPSPTSGTPTGSSGTATPTPTGGAGSLSPSWLTPVSAVVLSALYMAAL
ncbi:cutinase-domain-containing protein [Podospora australis]|uniref:Cutinase-domain-containing protein n=1 Tax=Podospora australis TaxID=1536484 RepID=A0AAN7AJV0_9PEZI|nr:cutinase-domain-containing protein [Podospora australis]